MRENGIAIEDYHDPIPAGWYTVEFWEEPFVFNDLQPGNW